MGINILVIYPDSQKPLAEALQEQIRSWQHTPILVSDTEYVGDTKQILQLIQSSQIVVSLVTATALSNAHFLQYWHLSQIHHKWLVQFCVEEVDIAEPLQSEDLLPFQLPLMQKLQQLEQITTRYGDERAEFEQDTQQTSSFVPTTAETPSEKRLPPVKSDRRWHNPFYVVADFLLVLTLFLSLMWLMTELGFWHTASWFEPLATFLGVLTTILQGIAFIWQSDALGIGINRLRKRLLDRTQTSWIEGVLYTALEEGREFGIEVTTRPNAIVSRRKLGAIPLPDTRNILTIFETMRERMLILGKPGAGKTIMLLQLAESMIKKAHEDDSAYIPLVFNLASWGRKEPDMMDWILVEAQRNYRLRHRQTKKLLKQTKLALLLDGLDEVGDANDDEKRARCVQAINTFKDRHWVPIVVCSRIGEYGRIQQDLNQLLQLEGAIQLEPLPRKVVQAHLKEKGQTELLKAIQNDHVLYHDDNGYPVTILDEMSREPFFLNTMVYTYANTTAEGIGVYETPFARRKDLFELYIQKRFRQKLEHLDHVKSRRYLEWLATKMQVYTQQIVFRSQDINRQWLESESDRQLYDARWRYVSWTVYAYTITSFIWLGWLLNGWWMLLIMALIGIAYANRTLAQAKSDMSGYTMAFGLPTPRQLFLGGYNFLPILIVLLGIVSVGLDAVLSQWLSWWAIPIIALLTIPVVAGLFRIANTRSYVALNLAAALTVAMILVFVRIWVETLTWNGIIVFPMIALIFLFLINSQNAKSTSDLWIHADGKLGGILFVLLIGIGIGTQLALDMPISVLALMMVLAVIVGNTTGLLLPIEQFWVRWVIWRYDRLPMLRLERFLNAMKQAHMLRNMRGGYLFIHRTLRDYLAQDDEIRLWIRRLPDEAAVQRLIQIGEATGELVQNTYNTSPNERVKASAHVILDVLNEPDNLQMQMVKRLDTTTWSVGMTAYQWLKQHDWQPTNATEKHRAAFWQQQWSKCPTSLLAEKIEQLDNSKMAIAIGGYLAEVGDPRQGVGLRRDGLPDIVWCKVESGEFQFGDHRQTGFLDTFYIAKYPVTYKQFATFINAPDRDDAIWWERFPENANSFSSASFPIANHPRDSVSWYQAMAFARWLTEKYRKIGLLDATEIITLPTEQQWEKAARGVDGRRYPWGNEFDLNYANVMESNLQQTTPVGAYGLAISPYGCLDMSGNVWEWCLNEYDSGQVNINSTSRRALRGGSWDDNHDVARAAYRFNYFPSLRAYDVGVRFVRSPS